MFGKRTSVPFDSWPERDRRLWQQALSPGGFLADGGPAAHWRPHTRDQVRKGYAKWLRFLAETGLLDPASHPVERISTATLEAYVGWLEAQDLSSVTIASRATDLLEALRVMAPGTDLALLRDLVLRLRLRERPRRDKAALVHPADACTAACRYLDGLHRNGQRSRLALAARYRDGLALALVAARPIRRRNLARIELDRHLVRHDSGYRLRFEADETKEHRPFAVGMPDRLTRFVDRYLEVHRPVLLGAAETTRLWVATGGRPLAEFTLYDSIRRLSQRLLGMALSPHRFRDVLATTQAVEDPAHVLVASRLLGHGDVRTTNRAYNQSRMVQALDAWYDVLDDLRDEEPA